MSIQLIKNSLRRLSHSALLTGVLFSAFSYGEMIAIDEDEMAETIGQAFIQIENYNANEHPDFENGQSNYAFTRIQFGLEAKMLLNADKIELGRYDRNDDMLGPSRPSDLLFHNFALGHIDQNGEIVPFEMKDPFIEFAYDESGSKKDLIGLRFGFGEARGTLSNDIQHMTGNIDVTIKDTGLSVDLFGGVNLPGPVESTAELITPDGYSDDIRATTIGIPNGAKFDFTLFGFIPLTLSVDDCTMSLVNKNTCFPLSKYRSVPIGTKVNDDPENHEYDYGQGMFVSFQTVNDLKWGAPDEELRDTVKGAFFNVPRESLTINFEQADHGIPRSRTEFINRGIVMGAENARWGTESVYKPPQ